jgi:hypothetical protein
MSRSLRILGAVALMVVGTAGGIYAAADKVIEKRGPAPPPPVAATLESSLDQVELAIHETFNEWSDLMADLKLPPGTPRRYKSRFPYGSQWDHFYLFRNEGPQLSVFPGDDQIRLTAGANLTILNYLEIAPALRSRDLYLNEPSFDEWWESEYVADGKPAKFRCAFLIHLEPAGGAGTRLEIFEYQPTIWAGERLGFSAHALPVPVWLHDIRFVDATARDREEVLRLIQATLAKRGSN